jgi:hypothetical protein
LGCSRSFVEEGYARFVCPQGKSTLSLEQADMVPPSATTVFFECEDLDATVSALKAAGVDFESGPVDQP